MSEKQTYIRSSFTCTCGGTMRATCFIHLNGLSFTETNGVKFYEYHADNFEGDEYICDKCGKAQEVRFLTIEYSNKDKQSTQGEKL